MWNLSLLHVHLFANVRDQDELENNTARVPADLWSDPSMTLTYPPLNTFFTVAQDCPACTFSSL